MASAPRRITFTATPAERLGKANTGAATLERIGDYATFLLCAEAVGVLDALNHATVEYTKERKQFGTPIARFQALQHRMVEMLIHAEQARSITYLAAARYTSEDADERRRAISAAKVAGRSGGALSSVSRPCNCMAGWA
jgi:alkylation response protein AidB-like acyl-CoA dehydrogenase